MSGSSISGSASKRSDRPATETVVLDANTAEPLGVAPPPSPPRIDPDELLRAEHSTPDGPSAVPRERFIWPWMMVGMGVAGVVVVASLMYSQGGIEAAAMGVVWLLMGYAVAWIVVWAAGVARAKEEREIEEQIDQRHRQG